MSLSRRLMPLAVALGLALPGHVLAAGTEPSADPPGLKKDAGQLTPAGKAAAEKAAAEKAAAEKGKVVPPPRLEKGKGDKRSEWRNGYRVAVSFIQGGRYDDAIARLVSLDKADSPDVLNYIGYANRKMGRMEEARASYEGALALDRNHRGALEYYGEWHVEMGKLDSARGYLVRLASVCGIGCREYQDLADAIASKAVR